MYQLKITGEGTKEELIAALHTLAQTIEMAQPADFMKDGKFVAEDETLCAVITEIN